MLGFKTQEGLVNYCESIAICNDQLKRAVQDARYALALQKSDSTYKSALAASVELDDGQLMSVKIQVGSKKVDVLLPESWLQAYVFALRKFKDEYGEIAYNTISNRYNKGWDATKVYTTENIGRRTWNNRREKFLSIFSVVATQFNLVYLE